MNSVWVLVFMTFSYIDPRDPGAIDMNAWKNPYLFGSLAQCEQIARESRRMSPDEKFVNQCVEVDRNNISNSHKDL